MSKINTGGPAFPVSTGNPDAPHQDGHTTAQFPGMTLRDYFAAKAIPSIYMVAMKEAAEGSGLFQYEDWRTGLALDAYAMADAMLNAREGGAK